jgi:hypothetical protein
VERAARAGEEVHLRRVRNAIDAAQRVAQVGEPARGERGCVDVDVWRLHLDGDDVEPPPREHGEDLLGDADAIREADVEAHGIAL